MERASSGTPDQPILPQLSLFGPDSEEDSSGESVQEDPLGTITAPLSVDEYIKKTPSSLSELLDIVHSRIQCRTELLSVPLEEQQNFIAILTGELTSQFRVIHHQIDDPFLDAADNKELHRRIVVEIISILENLFSKFLLKAIRLTQRKSLFSIDANMCRLRAQLAVEANTSINIPLIRRKVLDVLRGSVRIKRELRTPPVPHFSRKSSTNEAKTEDAEMDVLRTFELDSRSVASRKVISKIRKNLNQAIAYSESRQASLAPSSRPDDDSIGHHPSEMDGSLLEETVDDWTPHISRSYSLPELWQNFVLEDIGDRRGPQHVTEKEPRNKLWKISKISSVESLKDICLLPVSRLQEEDKTTVLGELTDEYLEQDLNHLVARHKNFHTRNEDIGDELLSPLLQAHVHGLNPRKSKLLVKLQSKFKAKDTSSDNMTKDEKVLEPVAASMPPISLHPPQNFAQFRSSSAGTTEEFSEFLSASQMSDTVGELPTMPVASQQPDKPSNLNSMIQMASFFQQHADGMADRDDVPPSPSEPQTPTADRCDVNEDNCYPEHSQQPAVVTCHMPNNEIVQTSDVRVSDRVPQQSLKLHSFKPLYNEISGQVSSKKVKEIDKGLRKSEEIREVYEEILKSTPKDHLVFHKDKLVEPSIDGHIDLSKVLASSTLQHRRNRRIINNKLHRNIPPPWGAEGRKEWEENQSYTGPTPEDILGKDFTGPVPPELAPMLRAYNTWVTWWKSTINADDYMKYVIKQENDYLGAIYHLYHSDDGDSEEEERKKEEKKLLEAKQKKLIEREKQLAKLTKRKFSYTVGLWNVNSVAMGGLGKDPDLTAEEQSGLSDLIKENDEGMSNQARLERIWVKLEFPEHMKMDMAIKYCSSPDNIKRLPKALELWEEACVLIERRENLLKRLEEFERDASDPARYFSSKKKPNANRLQEAKQRLHLHRLIDEADKKTSKLVRTAQADLNDTITYQGRSYQDKMRSDRTEMLYWLQQERRQESLMPAVQTLNNVILPPLSLSQVL